MWIVVTSQVAYLPLKVPKNKSSSIRSFAVVSKQAWWFIRAWYVSFHKGSPDNVVHGEVVLNSTRRLLTNCPWCPVFEVSPHWHWWTRTSSNIVTRQSAPVSEHEAY